MTVWRLTVRLAWLMLSRRCRPGDPVVREWGEWDEKGRSNYKQVDCTDPLVLNLRPAPAHLAGTAGLRHRHYGHGGEGEPRRVVALD